MDVDDVLHRIGGFGATQQKIFLLIGLPHIWSSLQILSFSYTSADPGWNCTRPSSASAAVSALAAEGVDVRTLTDLEMKCAYYEQGKCVPEYSKEFTSIVTEWNLICSRAYYSNLSQSGLFTGLLIGGFLFGTLSDTYGRKKTYFLSLLGATICHVFSGLTSTFSIYFLARILLGVFCSGFIIIGYTILLEVVSTSKRSKVGMAVHVFLPFGYVVVALTAYYIREWRTFTVLSGFLGGVFLSTWRMTPESPRWLLTQGREEEAVATLDWIARGNGSKMPDCKLQNAVHVGRQSAGRSVSVLDLLRGNAIRHRTIVLAVAWFTNCAVYYALSLNASALVRGRYLPTVLFGLIELPAYCASYILITRLGRRSGHVFFLVLSGVCCLAWSLADSSGMSASTKTVLALLGKMAIAGSFGVLYFYSAELFPTQVRTLGMGISSVSSRLGGVISPLIFLMPRSLSMVLLGFVGVFVGLLTLSLPETLNHPLPETLSQLNSHTV